MRPAYSDVAIGRAKAEALSWIKGNRDGYPRSWKEEERRDACGFYDPEFEAPVIAGYEALEKEGRVVRVGVVFRSTQERVHFRLV